MHNINIAAHVCSVLFISPFFLSVAHTHTHSQSHRAREEKRRDQEGAEMESKKDLLSRHSWKEGKKESCLLACGSGAKIPTNTGGDSKMQTYFKVLSELFIALMR